MVRYKPRNNHTMTKKTIFIFISYLIPCVTLAQNFVPLSPDIENMGYTPGQTGMTNLINKFFGISIAIAAILAVIMVAIGGFKYMTNESAFRLGDAKEQITNAIIGLILVLAAVVILSTINPDIVNLNLFRLS